MTMLGENPCQGCKHSKLAHRAGLGVCTSEQCECKVYLSGEYRPDKAQIKLMGQPPNPAKRERAKKTSESKSGDTVQVIDQIICVRCRHYQSVHEMAFDDPDSTGGACNGFGCECWKFTADPADENNWERPETRVIDQVELESVSMVTEPANPHCTTDLVDVVNHPPHYTSHPSGVECITITEHMNFCIGNAVKYLWRADLKGGLEDLEKALWYVQREIARRKNASA